MTNKKLLFFQMKFYPNKNTKSNIPRSLLQNKITTTKEFIFKLLIIQTDNPINNFRILLHQMK